MFVIHMYFVKDASSLSVSPIFRREALGDAAWWTEWDKLDYRGQLHVIIQANTAEWQKNIRYSPMDNHYALPSFFENEHYYFTPSRLRGKGGPDRVDQPVSPQNTR